MKRGRFLRCVGPELWDKQDPMEIFHREEGEGPTLVLTHGWTVSHRFFERQIPLREHFRLVFWDLPGHGDSEKRPEGHGLADCALALRALLHDLRVETAFGLGWSMGAEVLWEYVRRFGPEPFTRILNVESVPWGDPRRYRPADVEKSFRRDRAHAQRKFLKSMFYAPPPEATLQWMLEEALKTPSDSALKIYRELSRCDYRETFQKCPVPILSMLGRYGFNEDRIFEMMELRPHQQTFWFENSRHLPFWEEAEAFNRLLVEQLRA